MSRKEEKKMSRKKNKSKINQKMSYDDKKLNKKSIIKKEITRQNSKE